MIEADDFARRFKMRGAGLGWLLGAGCSASAGIPTANDMVWEFKQQLYVSQRRVSLKTVSDLSNPAIREQLQSYFDSSGRMPALGSNDEYASYFEAAWPNEQDRRAYLDAKMRGAKPSYGHLGLATLMKAGVTKTVWTTNFDSLNADACAKIYDSTSNLTVVALDAPDVASQMMSAQRWPIEIKLHGDFRSRRLKNTNDELRQQDARLRQIFVASSLQSGLVVAGYSGRDDSIMETFLEAVKQPGAFGAGLFWLHRGDAEPLPMVSEVLSRATALGIDAGIVQIDNFDETIRDIVRLNPGLDTTVLDAFGLERRRWSPAPKPNGTKRYPIVRLNALPILAAPTVARRVTCNIGGHADVLKAVQDASVEVLIARKRAGILAFGSDIDVRKAFEPFTISEFDLHPIETARLRYDSAERGLLREALSTALGRELDMNRVRRRNTDLLTPKAPNDSRWNTLKRLAGSLSGTVPGNPDLKWAEGVGVRLDWADEKLWLLVEPRIVLDGVTEENRFVATDFTRERTVRRYNRQLSEFVSFWAETLAFEGHDLRALNVSGGVDAIFRLSANTAFSWRVTP